MIAVVFGQVKFAGSPPINAGSLSQEGLGLDWDPKINNTETATLGAISRHLASHQFFYTLHIAAFFFIIPPSYF